MHASLPAKEAVGQPTWKAVVLYNEIESGKDAARLLHQVASRAGEPASCNTSLWRFDVMKNPKVARQALYEARDAHLVLLSARGMGHPPSWLVEWLEMWAMTRREREAVLAALSQGPCLEGGRRAVEGLRKLAETHHLDFIWTRGENSKRGKRTPPRPARRTE